MTKSFGYYCIRYVGYMLLIMAIVIALVYAAYAFVPDLAARYLDGNAGTGVVTTIVPALMVGQLFFRLENRKMTRSEGWRLAVAITALAFVVSGVIFWAFVEAGGLAPSEWQAMSNVWSDGRQILLLVLAGLSVFYVLINRFMLWSGVRGAMKQSEKHAATAARKG